MNGKVRKALKILGITIAGFMGIIVVFLGCLCICHQARLQKERSAITHLTGQYVEIDGHNLNVYVDGEGDKTLVFLPGSMTPSPIFDFKPLYERLTDKYRIVMMEKFGYGYSDECEGERSVDVITRQDREALAALGMEGPSDLNVQRKTCGMACFFGGRYSCRGYLPCVDDRGFL